MIPSREAYGLGREARLQEWHRRFHLHLLHGMEIAGEASGRSKRQKPTNRLRGHTSCLAESITVSKEQLKEDGIAHFRGHKFWGTTESAGCRSVPHLLLTQTIIGNLDVSIKSQKNVIQLQITVNHTILVEILQSKTDFSCVEPMS